MATGLKISGFLLGLTAVFGIGFGVGSALDPVHGPDTAPQQPHSVPAPDQPGDGTDPGSARH